MDWLYYLIIIVGIILGLGWLLGYGVKIRGYKSCNQVKRDNWKYMQKKCPVKVENYEVNKRSWKKSKAKYF